MKQVLKVLHPIAKTLNILSFPVLIIVHGICIPHCTVPLSLSLLFLSLLKIPFLCWMTEWQQLVVLLELWGSLAIGGWLSATEDGEGWEDVVSLTCLGKEDRGLKQGGVEKRMTGLQTWHTKNDENLFTNCSQAKFTQNAIVTAADIIMEALTDSTGGLEDLTKVCYAINMFLEWNNESTERVGEDGEGASGRKWAGVDPKNMFTGVECVHVTHTGSYAS